MLRHDHRLSRHRVGGLAAGSLIDLEGTQPAQLEPTGFDQVVSRQLEDLLQEAPAEAPGDAELGGHRLGQLTLSSSHSPEDFGRLFRNP